MNSEYFNSIAFAGNSTDIYLSLDLAQSFNALNLSSGISGDRFTALAGNVPTIIYSTNEEFGIRSFGPNTTVVNSTISTISYSFLAACNASEFIMMNFNGTDDMDWFEYSPLVYGGRWNQVAMAGYDYIATGNANNGSVYVCNPILQTKLSSGSIP